LESGVIGVLQFGSVDRVLRRVRRVKVVLGFGQVSAGVVERVLGQFQSALGVGLRLLRLLPPLAGGLAVAGGFGGDVAELGEAVGVVMASLP